MAPTLQQRQSTYSYDDDDTYESTFDTYRTTIIVIICVVLVIKIALIIWVCRKRSKVRAARKARGCHCYDDTDYYCRPWWYWGNERLCHCPPQQQPYGVPLEQPQQGYGQYGQPAYQPNGPSPPAYNQAYGNRDMVQEPTAVGKMPPEPHAQPVYA